MTGDSVRGSNRRRKEARASQSIAHERLNMLAKKLPVRSRGRSARLIEPPESSPACRETTCPKALSGSLSTMRDKLVTTSPAASRARLRGEAYRSSGSASHGPSAEMVDHVGIEPKSGLHLVGVFCGPRRAGLGEIEVRKDSRAGLALRNISSVHSGTSTASQSSWEMWSGFFFFITSDFSFVCLPEGRSDEWTGREL